VEAEEAQAESSGRGKLLMMGVVAAAVGAYFWAKKNNINIEGEARRHLESASVALGKLLKRQ